MIVLVTVDPMGLLMLLGFFRILIDVFLWGVAGYLVLRSLGVPDRHWFLSGLAISIAYLIIEQLIAGQAAFAIMAEGDTSELFAFGFGDVVMSLVTGYAGFAIGRMVFKIATRDSRNLQPLGGCPACGQEMRRGDLYCSMCGHSIRSNTGQNSSNRQEIDVP